MRGSIQAFRLGTMVAALSFAEAGLRADDFAPLFSGRDLSGWVEMGKPWRVCG